MSAGWGTLLVLGALVAVATWFLLPADAGPRLRALLPGAEDADGAGTAGYAGAAGSSGAAGTQGRLGGFAGLFRRLGRLVKRTSQEDLDAAAIAVVDRAVELLRVGMPPATVMTELAAITDRPELREVLHRTGRSLELGESPHEAVRRHLGSLPRSVAEVFDGMAAVWFVAETAGAPAADMLQRYAGTCRDKADAARERASQLAGPQSTVTVLTWLPFISLGLAMLIGANPFEAFGTAVGGAALVGGIGLLIGGRIWMNRLLRSAQ